ncbi:MAG: nucleotidyltransferase [Deltaproteobacteria bacterium]|nr:nucleotidyltransferase [Deltaproteobacteria bacterium]
MALKATDALSLAVELARELEAAGLPYAVGGALALGVHGVSRSTQDVDLNVFVKPEQLDALLELLARLGVRVDAASARTEGVENGVFFCWADSIRIDVFLPSIDLSWEALRTRVAAAVDGVAVWFLSAELLSCFKLLFFRPKNLLDLERLVASAASLDAARVRALVVEAMGEEDERVRAWDDIVRRMRSAGSG